MTPGIPAPGPALVIEIDVLLPSTTPEADIERAKALVEKLREFGPDATVRVNEVRWSKP